MAFKLGSEKRGFKNSSNVRIVRTPLEKDTVAEAFKIILSDKGVKAVLSYIIGRIVRSDIIAEGIIGAVKEVGVEVPVVVRFEGNNASVGAETLQASDVDIIAATSLTDAVQQAVKAAGGAA